MRRALISLASLLLSAAPALAGPKVGVVVGTDAPRLERFAADELAAQFKQLFDAEVSVADSPPAGADHLVLVGSPATNPHVAKAVGEKWPKLSEQGHVLRSVKLGDRAALVAGGGSPVATLWATYELGHHFGIRPFLHGDAYPEKTPELKLDGIDITLEPAVKVRAWRVLDGSPTGFSAWGLDDHKRLLRQLAKLKFNRVVLGVDPQKLADARTFPTAGDTPGRKAFKGAKEFDNPDLAGKAGADRAEAAVTLTRGVADAAAEFGLTLGEPPAKVRTVALRGFLPRVPAELPADADGFLIVAEVPGDLSPAVYALARRSFDPKLTAKDAHAQLFTPLIGAAATERLALGFGMIDEATKLIEKNDPKFFDVSAEFIAGLLKSGEEPPEWWKKAGKLYAGGMDEMYRGIRATFNDPARPLLLYYAKRCEFAVHYFACIDAARLAGVAKSKSDKEATVQHLEKATESAYNALNAYGDVARDPSDRGAIATLAEHLYRPLKAELKAAAKK